MMRSESTKAFGQPSEVNDMRGERCIDRMALGDAAASVNRS